MKPTSKIKKVKLPLKKMSKEDVNYAAVMLEELNHNFKAFGEVLRGVKERSDATYEKVGEMNERLSMVEIDLAEARKDINKISERLDKTDYHLNKIETEVSLLRRDFNEYQRTIAFVDKEKVSEMETRLIRVEKHLNLKLSMA